MIGEILSLVLYFISLAVMAYLLRAARLEAKYWKAAYADLIESLKKYNKEKKQ